MRETNEENRKTWFGYLKTCILLLGICVFISQFILINSAHTLLLPNDNLLQKLNDPLPPTNLENTIQKKEDKPDSRAVVSNKKENVDDIQRLITFAQGGQPPDDEALKDLPSSSDFKALYGDEIVFKGLETCEAYRNSVKEGLRHIGPAGIFNTGTNYLSSLLRKNCIVKNTQFKKGVRFQVPWGKHSPAAWRLLHEAEIDGEGVVQENVLPVVTIKDPYTWMTSMCRHSYVANWKHSEDHCPSLIPNEKDRLKFPSDMPEEGPIPLIVRYSAKDKVKHDSLLHLWNDYHRDYFEVTDYPRLIVRYEDFLTHPVEITTKVCECAGGVIKDPKNFNIKTESAKGNWGVHKGAQGLVSALKKYGNAEIRKSAFPDQNEVDFARENLDKELMEEFKYNYI